MRWYLCSDCKSVCAHWQSRFTPTRTLSPAEAVRDLNTEDAGQTVLFWDLTGDPSWHVTQIKRLSQQGWTLVALSPEPNGDEGIRLFQSGIKGYLETFPDQTTLDQLLKVIQQGNVWLGQTVMQAMVTGLAGNAAADPARKKSWQTGLTAREVEVAESILKGLSNKQIAQNLSVTERTVKAHVHNLLHKKQVRDRLALVLKLSGTTDA